MPEGLSLSCGFVTPESLARQAPLKCGSVAAVCYAVALGTSLRVDPMLPSNVAIGGGQSLLPAPVTVMLVVVLSLAVFLLVAWVLRRLSQKYYSSMFCTGAVVAAMLGLGLPLLRPESRSR